MRPKRRVFLQATNNLGFGASVWASMAIVLVGLGLPGTIEGQTVAFTGVTVWDGTGAQAQPGLTLLVQDGRSAALGADVAVPDDAEVVTLDGKFVTPGLVNAHGHVTGAWTDEAGLPPEDAVRGDLLLYARYGITSVLSLGDDTDALAVARAGVSNPPHARLRASGPVVTARTARGARETAEANVRAGADWLKLRVDDNLGTSDPMPWDAVEAVLDVGATHGVPVATHLFYLDDARRLLDMGTGLVAHSVRDRTVDDAFITDLLASQVCYVPTLTRELSTFVYESRPDFFDDPFFLRHASSAEVHRLERPDVQAELRESTTAEGYRRALDQARSNLVRLHAAGVPIAFGTDSGPAARFPGYFEHLELWMMVDAGLTPAEALRSATSVAAACAGFEDVGTLAPGQWADFLVFTDDPSVDIRATRSLERVYVGGAEVSGVTPQD